MGGWLYLRFGFADVCPNVPVSRFDSRIASTALHAFGRTPSLKSLPDDVPSLSSSDRLRAVAALGLRFVGDMWKLDDAAPAGPSPATHPLSRLGYRSRTDYVALPLTLLENWLELKANVQTYEGTFLLHYLDKLVYRDVFPTLLAVVAVAFCSWILAVYMGVLVCTYVHKRDAR